MVETREGGRDVGAGDGGDNNEGPGEARLIRKAEGLREGRSLSHWIRYTRRTRWNINVCKGLSTNKKPLGYFKVSL